MVVNRIGQVLPVLSPQFAFLPSLCVPAGSRAAQQAVIEIFLATGSSCKKIIKDTLGWTAPSSTPANAHIGVKVLSGAALHTFFCMLGYCLKDECSEHFQCLGH
eukprot:483893-Rhodomonas_salina.1